MVLLFGFCTGRVLFDQNIISLEITPATGIGDYVPGLWYSFQEVLAKWRSHWLIQRRRFFDALSEKACHQATMPDGTAPQPEIN